MMMVAKFLQAGWRRRIDLRGPCLSERRREDHQAGDVDRLSEICGSRPGDDNIEIAPLRAVGKKKKALVGLVKLSFKSQEENEEGKKHSRLRAPLWFVGVPVGGPVKNGGDAEKECRGSGFFLGSFRIPFRLVCGARGKG